MRVHAGDDARPLVLFTVLAQASVGMSAVAMLAQQDVPARLVPAAALALLLIGAGAAAGHLARPLRARHAFANLKTSGLSREVLLGGLYATVLVLQLVVGDGLASEPLVYAAAFTAIFFHHGIISVYRLRTVPAWDTGATDGMFLLTALGLGSALLYVVIDLGSSGAKNEAHLLFAGVAAVVQVVVLAVHLRVLEAKDGVARESAQDMRGRGRARLNARMVTALLAAGLLLAAFGVAEEAGRRALALAGTTLLVISELVGRRLFYSSYRRVGL